MRPRILVMADVTSCPEALDGLREIAIVEVLPADAGALRARIGGIDGYLASLEVRLDRPLLETTKRLRVIATPSTGRDHIDLACAAERGIEVLSLKDDIQFLNGVTATAELAWALLLAVVRRLPWAVAAAMNGDWARDRFRGHQISGLTLGILGYGRLGRMVAEFGKAFRMRVIACEHNPVDVAPGVEIVDMTRLLRESDVISIHIHLTEENRGLIGRRQFEMMKPGAVLINTSRGAVIDEEALVEALNSGRLAGAGLDVIEGEWRDDLDRHPLIEYSNTHENLVITPHIGGVTFESQKMAFGHIAAKMADFLRQTP